MLLFLYHKEHKAHPGTHKALLSELGHSARLQISLGSVMYPVMALAPAVAGEQR
jgi:hypothetical protein